MTKRGAAAALALLLPTSAPAGAAAQPTPQSLSLVAPSEVDLEMNSDLAPQFASVLSHPQPGMDQVILGGPAVNPGPQWEGAGLVSFYSRGGYYVGLTFRFTTYFVVFGDSDYAAVFAVRMPDGSVRVYVGGISRFGTRAGLVWLLSGSNLRRVLSGGTYIVHWFDSDADDEVDLGEISLVASG